MWGEILSGAIGTSITGPVIGWVLSRRQRKAVVRQTETSTDLTDAQTAQIFSQTAVEMLEPQRKLLNEVSQRVTDLQTETGQLRSELTSAVTTVATLQRDLADARGDADYLRSVLRQALRLIDDAGIQRPHWSID